MIVIVKQMKCQCFKTSIDKTDENFFKQLLCLITHKFHTFIQHFIFSLFLFLSHQLHITFLISSLSKCRWILRVYQFFSFSKIKITDITRNEIGQIQMNLVYNGIRRFR